VFELGGVYPAALNLYDENSQPVNAQAITLVITLPDQSTANCAITNPPQVTGQYAYPYITTQPGRHKLCWTTVNPITVYRDVFDVNSASPDAIISLADCKQTLQIDPADTSDDAELLAKLQAITHSVQRYMHTQYIPRQITQWDRFGAMPTWRHPRLRLTTLPVMGLISMVTMSPANTVVTTYDTVNNMIVEDPESGLVTVFNGPPLAGRLQTIYTAGYTAIPYNVIEGSKILLQHVWESRRGPGGLNGVIGPDEMADFRHFTALPRKATEFFGPPRPVIF
jgi:hypothetical protein